MTTMVREQAKFFWDDAWGPEPPSVPTNAGSGQAEAPASVAVTVPQATPAVTVPAPAPQASAPVVEHVSAPSAPIAAPAGIAAAPQSAPVLQAVSVPGVVTELQVPAGLQGGGTQPGASSLASSDTAEGSVAPLTLASHWSDGWFVVPSAANEYGQAYAASDGGFEFDVATGNFTSDWFFV